MLGLTAAQIGHTKGGKVVSLKKEESCEVASSQGL